jgi:hypothetical protein
MILSSNNKKRLHSFQEVPNKYNRSFEYKHYDAIFYAKMGDNSFQNNPIKPP